MNTLLAFPPEDQHALLDVIQDYFTLPVGSEDDDLSEDDDADGEGQAITEGTKKNKNKSNTKKIILNHNNNNDMINNNKIPIAGMLTTLVNLQSL